MYSYFDLSNFEILRRFDKEKPTTRQEICRELSNDRVKIYLGATVDFDGYLRALCHEGTLQIKEGGYLLTTKGERILGKIKEKIEKCVP